MKAVLVAAAVLSATLVSAAEAGPRHLIYLHGRIVQDRQDPRPRHTEFGSYELDQIPPRSGSGASS